MSLLIPAPDFIFSLSILAEINCNSSLIILWKMHFMNNVRVTELTQLTFRKSYFSDTKIAKIFNMKVFYLLSVLIRKTRCSAKSKIELVAKVL